MTAKGPYAARPAVLTGTTWQLRNSLSSGSPSQTFDFGAAGDTPVMGDFSNSGVRTVGVVRNARHGTAGATSLTWYIRQIEGPGDPDLVIRYGEPGDIPVVGDWDGDGVHTIGVVRGNRWMLKNSNRAGAPDYDFTFGEPGDIPVVGDWNGAGRTWIGMVRDNRWLLRSSLSSGNPHLDFTFGGDGYPVTGDWNGNGVTGVGWFSSGTWAITNTLSSGGTTLTFDFGDADGIPVTWGRNA
jgi:hypothetical protein